MWLLTRLYVFLCFKVVSLYSDSDIISKQINFKFKGIPLLLVF
jgi:hypothetical protein